MANGFVVVFTGRKKQLCNLKIGSGITHLHGPTEPVQGALRLLPVSPNRSDIYRSTTTTATIRSSVPVQSLDHILAHALPRIVAIPEIELGAQVTGLRRCKKKTERRAPLAPVRVPVGAYEQRLIACF